MIGRIHKLAGKYNVRRHIRGIRRRDFSLIASNCTGTLPYRFLRMRHLSPTVNLFFFAPDYLKFASRLQHYLQQPLKFIDESSYEDGQVTHKAHGRYPIGLLDDIEIHFMHYTSKADAKLKWERRAARVNFDNLIFTFTDRDLCTPELIRQFNELLGPKLLLSSRPMPWIPCAVTVPAFRGMSEMGDAYSRYDYLTHVNYRALIDGPEAHGSLLSKLSLAPKPAFIRTVSG